MMMKRTTEQITDVSHGNTAALVGTEQFLFLKIGTLKIVEAAHNTADDWIHVVAKIAVIPKDRRDSTRN